MLIHLIEQCFVLKKAVFIFNIKADQETNKIRRTRFSVGGTHYNPSIHTKELDCNINPFYIIETLEKMWGFGSYQEFNEIIIAKLLSFIEDIGKGSLHITRENKHYW